MKKLILRYAPISTHLEVLSSEWGYSNAAAKTLNTLLRGFRLEKRLPISGARAYGLLFRNSDKFAWALWTSSPKRRRLTLEAPLGNYRLWDYLGREQAKPFSKNGKVVLELNEAPQYLILE